FLGIPLWWMGAFAVGVLVLIVALGVMANLQKNRLPTPKVAILGPLILFLLLAGFSYVLRVRGGSGSSGRRNNTSGLPGGTGTPGGGNLTQNTTGFGSIPAFGAHVPILYVLIALVIGAALVGLVAAPYLLALRDDEPRGTELGPSRAQIRKSLEEAIRQLEGSGPVDPRTRIIAVYARLLARVSETADSFESRTPREIELTLTRGLRVKPATARTLTALFEEARYSTHSVDADLADRAREALQAALADLESAPGLL
ncbi:MAG: DUF4129 domain-containing protein, partial [Candidatus Lutacidiplasmatales archaeon]